MSSELNCFYDSALKVRDNAIYVRTIRGRSFVMLKSVAEVQMLGPQRMYYRVAWYPVICTY